MSTLSTIKLLKIDPSYYGLLIFPLVFTIGSILFIQLENDTISFYEAFLSAFSGAELILIGLISLLSVFLEPLPNNTDNKSNHFAPIATLLIISSMIYFYMRVKLMKVVDCGSKLAENEDFITLFRTSLILGLFLIVFSLWLLMLIKKEWKQSS